VPEVYLDALGPMLKARRAMRNLSLRDAAAECGVSFNAIFRTERGEGRPDLVNFARIVAWLGADAAQFFVPPAPDIPDQIAGLLAADEALPPPYAKVLFEHYRVLRETAQDVAAADERWRETYLQLPPCPACGCRTEGDPDATECGCDAGCNDGPYAPGVNVLIARAAAQHSAQPGTDAAASDQGTVTT
jgi:transcriptional regulator with XRE-family HTH domain